MELYPLTVEMGDDETFAELFGRVQRNLLDTMRHAKPGESPDLPFVGVLNVLTAQFGDFAGFPPSPIGGGPVTSTPHIRFASTRTTTATGCAPRST